MNKKNRDIALANKNILDERSFVFFGTPEFAVDALDEMKKRDFVPSLIVTAPDSPSGRGMKMVPPPVKLWGYQNNVEIIQPEQLDEELIKKIKEANYGFGVVAAYGKIIPQRIIDLFPFGILNIHPSLLPKYRGPSPLESAILAGETETGVTIIKIDAQTDHGPILAQQKVPMKNMKKDELGKTLFSLGGKLIAQVIPQLLLGTIKEEPQDDSQATFSKKISRQDGLIDLHDNPKTNWRKFRAYYPWPGIYFFTENNTRVKITDAALVNDEFIIKRVIPEGGKEVDYKNFMGE